MKIIVLVTLVLFCAVCLAVGQMVVVIIQMLGMVLRDDLSYVCLDCLIKKRG